jgi:NAD(P)H-flavin reductase/hemoglobin-like flavoprotein
VTREGRQVVDAAGLQRSFGTVAGFGDEVPLYFYSHLFLLNPQTRGMFPASMSAQRDRLVGALMRVVSNVHQVETVVPSLQQLARDHRKYGVVDEHYPLVGASLLATLEHFLGDDWTPELKADWAAAYGVIAQVMTEAAEESAQVTPPWYDAEIVDHDVRGPGLAVFTARPDRRVDYRPGQSMSVQTAHIPRVWRYLSPANAPRADGTLEFHVRAIDGGWVSPALVHVAGKGDVLRIGAPVGDGLELDETDRPVVMLAGGTGLAPLLALLEQMAGVRANGGVQRPARIFVGARNARELYDLPRLRAMQEEHSWLDVVPVVTDGGPLGLAVGEPAAVAVRQAGGQELAGSEIYVCGSGAMVATALETLASAGVNPEFVHRESYTYGVHEPPSGSLPAEQKGGADA